mmetsp:Transcript_16812/g.36149  ORF Transcript_16812/g.36149 Transcript_16812/m.36149 type:complete len:349 (+) Transcript_16812:113-1159(+)
MGSLSTTKSSDARLDSRQESGRPAMAPVLSHQIAHLTTLSAAVGADEKKQASATLSENSSTTMPSSNSCPMVMQAPPPSKTVRALPTQLPVVSECGEARKSSSDGCMDNQAVTSTSSSDFSSKMWQAFSWTGGSTRMGWTGRFFSRFPGGSSLGDTFDTYFEGTAASSSSSSAPAVDPVARLEASLCQIEAKLVQEEDLAKNLSTQQPRQVEAEEALAALRQRCMAICRQLEDVASDAMLLGCQRVAGGMDVFSRANVDLERVAACLDWKMEVRPSTTSSAADDSDVRANGALSAVGSSPAVSSESRESGRNALPRPGQQAAVLSRPREFVCTESLHSTAGSEILVSC